MKTFFAALVFCFAAAFAVHAQEKGVDRQNDQIRDTGNERTPGINGTNKNIGTGRGVDFGKGRTPTLPPIPNPYRLTARRDAVIQAAQEMMRDRGMTVDTASSKLDTGLIISQPYTFIRGEVVTLSELSRVSDLPTDDSRGWARGRYTLIIEATPVDVNTTKVSVTARIEGKSQNVTGAQWISLRSNGTIEQEFLSALIENITGAPAQRTQP
jgi:hypothetical protein